MNIGIACSADAVLRRENWLLLEAFTNCGHTARIVVFDSIDTQTSWSSFDLVIIRACNSPRFLPWIQSISQETILVNAGEIILWSAQRRGMDYLSQRGIPIVPTYIISQQSPITTIINTIDTNGWSEGILKPSISSANPTQETLPILIPSTNSSISTTNLEGAQQQQLSSSPGATHLLWSQRVESLRSHVGEVVLQPLIRSVLREGVLSFVFIGGIFCHSIRRISSTSSLLNCGVELFSPSDDELFFAVNAYGTIAAAIRDSCGQDIAPTFARIDVIKINENNSNTNTNRNGSKLLIKDVDLIDPELSLDICKDSAKTFVEASINLVIKTRAKRLKIQSNTCSRSATLLPTPLGSPIISSTIINAASTIPLLLSSPGRNVISSSPPTTAILTVKPITQQQQQQIQPIKTNESTTTSATSSNSSFDAILMDHSPT